MNNTDLNGTNAYMPLSKLSKKLEVILDGAIGLKYKNLN